MGFPTRFSVGLGTEIQSPKQPRLIKQVEINSQRGQDTLDEDSSQRHQSVVLPDNARVVAELLPQQIGGRGVIGSSKTLNTNKHRLNNNNYNNIATGQSWVHYQINLLFIYCKF